MESAAVKKEEVTASVVSQMVASFDGGDGSNDRAAAASSINEESLMPSNQDKTNDLRLPEKRSHNEQEESQLVNPVPSRTEISQINGVNNLKASEPVANNVPENGSDLLTAPSEEPAMITLDADDPLPSGFGEVSKDCNEEELRGWPQVLATWKGNLQERPRELSDLVRRGIPEALRGEVWQMLANCYNDEELIAEYAVLLVRPCRDEVYVQRDISRTFPAHAFFREPGSAGQESLHRVCRAYSVHDEEIGYCQGMSFVAAALLLHMPEEQAFCVLVKIMQVYGLRNLFKCGFEELHLRFFQLERFMEDQLPDLFTHFVEKGIEAHMYASQWFLTLFSAKFPLYLVFSILDIYLLDGFPTMFQVAVSLLQLSKADLLALDFEGILKYFRISLPKKYRTEDAARQLLQTANSRTVQKQLRAYEKEYVQLKEQDKQRGDAIQRMQKENRRLLLNNMQLELQLDDMARDLINSKVELRKQLDVSEDKADTLNKELLNSNSLIVDLEEERSRLVSEVAQLKEVCRRELDRAEKEIARNGQIIVDYKQITAKLSERLEKGQAASKETVDQITEAISSCDKCSKAVAILRLGQSENGVNGNNGNAAGAERVPSSDSSKNGQLDKRLRELELELAQTKLALVEAECQNQDLQHELTCAQSQIEASKNNWYHRTVKSIKETKNNLAQRRGESGGLAKGLSLSRENSREFNQ